MRAPCAPVDRGIVQVVELDAATLMRTTFEPGWRWSECVKPIVGGESCQVHHVGYVISGRLHARMDTGEDLECGPGDAARSRLATTPGWWAMSPTLAWTSRAGTPTPRRNRAAWRGRSEVARPLASYPSTADLTESY
jgi:hypothetical protein